MQNLEGLPLHWQPELEGCAANRWLSVALVEDGCGVTAAQVLDALKADDIEGRHVWKPMHMQPVFASAKFVTAGGESVSEDLFRRGVCLPSDTKMTDADIDRICDVIRRAFA